jgi:hypothetical protein
MGKKRKAEKDNARIAEGEAGPSKPISLSPLSPEDALRAFMEVPPPTEEPKQRKKRKKEVAIKPRHMPPMGGMRCLGLPSIQFRS